jgi:hypothetical protein
MKDNEKKNGKDAQRTALSLSKPLNDNTIVISILGWTRSYWALHVVQSYSRAATPGGVCNEQAVSIDENISRYVRWRGLAKPIWESHPSRCRCMSERVHHSSRAQPAWEPFRNPARFLIRAPSGPERWFRRDYEAYQLEME